MWDRVQQAEISKQRAANESNVFAGRMVADRIEDEKTYKVKCIPRAQKFAKPHAVAVTEPESKPKQEAAPQSAHSNKAEIAKKAYPEAIPRTEYCRRPPAEAERRTVSMRVQAKPFSVCAASPILAPAEEQKPVPPSSSSSSSHSQKQHEAAPHEERKAPTSKDSAYARDERRFFGVSSHCSSKASCHSQVESQHSQKAPSVATSKYHSASMHD